MIKFIKDEENYEIRIANGDEYEVAGELVKDEDGVWCFSYGEQIVAYEDSLEETEDELKSEFENGKSDSMIHYFGSYKYNK